MIDAVAYCVCSVLILLIIKQLNPEFSLLGGAFVSIVICCTSISLFITFFDRLSKILTDKITEELTLIMKVAGISICMDVGAGICTSVGYDGVASALRLYGKIYLLIMALPLLKELLDSVSYFV